MKEINEINSGKFDKPLKNLAPVLILFLLSRAFFLLMMFLGGRYSFSEILTLFDAEHYLNIAESGYYHESVTTFFPVIPLILRFLGKPGLLVINNISFLASLYLLKKILEDSGYKETALLITAILAFSPVGFFSMLLYTEALFFFLTLLVFYFFSLRKYYLLSGILLGLSVCVRNTGSMLFAAIFIAEVVLLLKKEIRFKSILLEFAPATALSLAYPVFLQLKFGNWKIFADAQTTYWIRISSNIFKTLFTSLKVIFSADLSTYEDAATTILFKVNESITTVLFIFSIVLVVKEILKLRKGFNPEGLILVLFMSLCIFCFGLTIRDPLLDCPTDSFYRYYYGMFPFFLMMKNLKKTTVAVCLGVTFLLSTITSMLFCMGVFFF